jgi:hypothetical protein
MVRLFLVCVSTLMASSVVVIALTILDILKARKLSQDGQPVRSALP